MTGRLNKIDLHSDLYFLVLYVAHRPIYRTELKDVLDNLRLDEFIFETAIEDYPGFMDNLETLEELEAIPKLRQRKRIELTDKGEMIAEGLVEEAADEGQMEAIVDAVGQVVDADG